jgi:hypothetical protein
MTKMTFKIIIFYLQVKNTVFVSRVKEVGEGKADLMMNKKSQL